MRSYALDTNIKGMEYEFMKLCFCVFKSIDEEAPDWLGIGYLSSSAKRIKGIEIHVLFYEFSQIEKALNDMYELNPDIIASPLLQFNYHPTLEFINLLDKSILNSKIILGNIEATLNAKMLLNNYHNIDIIVKGEGEETLFELLNKIQCNGDLSLCKGIIFRERTNIIETDDRELVTDIDSYLFPDRSFIKTTLRKYMVIGSRGCLGRCTFCNANTLYNDNLVRTRSIDNILDEIEELINRYSCEIVEFADSSFCAFSSNTLSRFELLYEGIKKRGLKFTFYLNMRAEQVDTATVNMIMKLKEVGLRTILVGFETGNRYDFNLYGKHADFEDNINVAKLFKEYGILTGECGINFDYGFMNFNPYTSIDRLKENIEFLKMNNINTVIHVLATRLKIFTGSTITKKIFNDGLLKGNIKEPIIDPFQYNFKNEGIEAIYDLIVYCNRNIRMRFYGRLIHYYQDCIQFQNDYNKINSQNLSILYEYQNYCSYVTFEIMDFIINMYNNKNIYRLIDCKIIELNKILDEYSISLDAIGNRLAIDSLRLKRK